MYKVELSTLSKNQQTKIFRSFYDNTKSQHERSVEKLETFIERPDIPTMLSLCDSNKRWQNFNRLWKNQPELKKRQRIGLYDQDVLKPRNFLAHGTPIPQENGEYVFCHHEEEFLFNEEISLTLRKTILYYKNKLSEIITLLA